jgi:hypothetical protein
VNAEYFGCNNGCDRQAVEDVYECLPNLDTTSSFAFVIKAINCGNIRKIP